MEINLMRQQKFLHLDFTKTISIWEDMSSSQGVSINVKNALFSCFTSVQLLSRVQLFATPWITAHQASLSITNSRSSLKLMCIESVMPSSHLILCRPLLLLPLIPPSIRVFSNESTLCMRWPKYWEFQWFPITLTSWYWHLLLITVSRRMGTAS